MLFNVLAFTAFLLCGFLLLFIFLFLLNNHILLTILITPTRYNNLQKHSKAQICIQRTRNERTRHSMDIFLSILKRMILKRFFTSENKKMCSKKAWDCYFFTFAEFSQFSDHFYESKGKFYSFAWRLKFALLDFSSFFYFFILVHKIQAQESTIKDTWRKKMAFLTLFHRSLRFCCCFSLRFLLPIHLGNALLSEIETEVFPRCFEEILEMMIPLAIASCIEKWNEKCWLKCAIVVRILIINTQAAFLTILLIS